MKAPTVVAAIKNLASITVSLYISIPQIIKPSDNKNRKASKASPGQNRHRREKYCLKRFMDCARLFYTTMHFQKRCSMEQ